MDKVVKIVSIADEFTRQLIFGRIYSWKNVQAFSSLSKLIETFYMFARTVDDGNLIGIDFEVPQQRDISRRSDDHLKAESGETMHLMTTRTRDICVSVFFDMKCAVLLGFEQQRLFKIFLSCIKVAFEHLFMNHLYALRKRYNVHGVQSMELDPVEMDCQIFTTFSDTVDHIYNAVFINQKEGTVVREGQQQPAAESQLLSIEEEVRKCLNSIGIHVSEIVLDQSG